MSTFFDNIFSNQQCGFRKGYSIQHCLLVMLKTGRSPVDKGKVFGALLTDLSKAFDCLDHKLLTAKLNAYGFSLPTLRLINDYLSNRKQRKRIHSLDQRIVRKQLDIMPTYNYVQNQRKLMMQSRENGQKPQFGQFLTISRPNILKLQMFLKNRFHSN